MFRIEVQTDDAADNAIHGLNALDLRRKLKLPDQSHFVGPDRATRWVDVDEGFARAHFRPDEVSAARQIPLSALCPGDLQNCGDPNLGGTDWANADTLTDERIRQLFAIGKPY